VTAPGTAAGSTLTSVPATAAEYLGLSPQRRYDIVSQQFPDWLLAEPIEFPPHHPTYGWHCRVEDCDGGLHVTAPSAQLCVAHARRYAEVKDTVTYEVFIADAEPNRSRIFGHALIRSPGCAVGDCKREQVARGYCRSHLNSLRKAQSKDASESDWYARQLPLPQMESCAVDRCVHDKAKRMVLGGVKQALCTSHAQHLRNWLKQPGTSQHDREWEAYFRHSTVVASVSPPSARGLLSLAALPIGLQREIRYAVHRHAQIAWRAQWRPSVLRTVGEMLTTAGVRSLCDPAVAEMTDANTRSPRYVLLALVSAARSLMFTAESARTAGWFDPILVGAAPFRDAGGRCRRKPWDLTPVKQHCLRDVLWDHLRDEALKPAGRSPTAQTIYYRLSGVGLLSAVLEHNRADHGEDPRALGKADAETVKQTWDLWFQEKIPLPVVTAHNQPRVFSASTRQVLMSAVRIVLRDARAQGRTAAELDPFILSLPEYPVPQKNP
jgi:hypothetical protein